jgi:hypothetical protein
MKSFRRSLCHEAGAEKNPDWQWASSRQASPIGGFGAMGATPPLVLKLTEKAGNTVDHLSPSNLFAA